MIGPVELRIELTAPTKRKFDLSNRVKIIEDLLVKQRIITDDNHEIVRKVTVEIGKGFTGARVTVVSA
jgi:hypothetical protein